VSYLARLAKLPTRLYVLLALISRRQIISGSAGTIFAIFSPNESVLGADERSGPLFPISQGTLPWQPILWKKMANFELSLVQSIIDFKLEMRGKA